MPLSQFKCETAYEEIIEAECKFDAAHNIRMGNTVVENAKIAVIDIALDSKIEALERSQNKLTIK